MALRLLNFGPDFRHLAEALTSERARPIRTIKINGGRSYPFTIGSGRCPLSPLTFLLTTEALTRSINGDPDIRGVDLNGYDLRISQFADDTALIARDYTSLKRALVWVRAHERALGGKTNEAKFQGLRMGSQMCHKPPWDMRKYNWIANDQCCKMSKCVFPPPLLNTYLGRVVSREGLKSQDGPEEGRSCR